MPTLIAEIGAVAMVAALCGLIVRRRTTFCISFTAYLMATLISNRLTVVWPEIFFTIQAYTIKDIILTTWRLVIAVELAFVALSAFERARQRALAAMTITTSIISFVIVVSPRETYMDWLGTLLPRAQIASLLGFLGLLIITSWHRLPLHAHHRRIITGFSLYIGVHATVLSLLPHASSEVRTMLSALDAAANTASALMWVHAAWTADRSALSSEARQELQPWSVR